VKEQLCSVGSKQGPMSGPYEHDNDSLGFLRGGKFTDHVSDKQLLKNDSVAVS
jgi:hypothetical protein